MKISIISLFPGMFEGIFAESMLFKAQDIGALEVEVIDLREFGIGLRRTVDDTPYGGGDGMLLKPEPLFAAVERAKQANPNAKVLLMTPRGKLFTQNTAQALANEQAESGLIIICGRYEGYDERIVSLVDDELSVGRYVLTGGELPAMIITDAVTRLLPGVLGGQDSAEIESYSQGDLMEVEFPQYTRPEDFQGMKVPDVLLSGHHAEIEAWRKEQSRLKSQELQEQDQS